MELALGYKVLLSILGISVIGLSIMIFWIISDKKTVQENAINSEKEIENIKKLMSAPKVPINLNFEKDIEYLLFLVNFKVNQTKDYILAPININTRFINKDVLENEKIAIVMNVLNLISPEYKLVLMKYVPESEIKTLVAELVVDSLDKISIDFNKQINAKIK